jgi:hypothetical protein
MRFILIGGLCFTAAAYRETGEVTPDVVLGAFVCATALYLAGRPFRRLFIRKRGEVPLPDPLEQVLYWWDAANAFTRRHLLQSVLVLGISGSGKSSGPLLALARGIFADANIGGVINESKPEETEFWTEREKESPTPDRLIPFGPGYPARFNFLEFLTELGADSRELAAAIMTLEEAIANVNPGEGGEQRFFERAKAEHLETAIEVIRLAKGTVSASDIERFISTAAYTPEELTTEKWRNDFQNQCFKQAYAKEKTDVQKFDFQHAWETWIGAFPRLAEKTRSSIVADMKGVLHVFCSGVVRELLGTTTNVTPKVTAEGRFIDVRMWITKYGASGAFVNGAIKLANQKYVLWRKAQKGDAINVNIIDEYQSHITPPDPDYLAQCRSHLGCMLVLTQSVHAIYSAMRGKTGEHQAKSLLSNFGSKLFMTVDAETAEWAVSHLGKHLDIFTGGSTKEGDTLADELFHGSEYTANFSESFTEVLQPRALLGGLRTGGPRCGFYVDGILIRNSEWFADGSNHLFCSFSQR